MAFPSNDDQCWRYVVESVEGDPEKGWPIRIDGGWSFWVPPESPVVPTVGMACRMYGKGIGYTVRGLFLDGREVFYRTEAEDDEKHRLEQEQRDQEKRYNFEKNRADHDRRYRALPAMFQARLDRFRSNNPEFRWDYEPYEMFCCEQAVVIASAFRSGDRSPTAILDRINKFKSLPWEDQIAAVPGLDEGHSGNTFGCAVSLAYAYLTDPEVIPRMHGAMSPLVGSVAYGDVPRSEGV